MEKSGAPSPDDPPGATHASLISASGNRSAQVHHVACLIGYGIIRLPQSRLCVDQEIVHEGRKTNNLTVEQAQEFLLPRRWTRDCSGHEQDGHQHGGCLLRYADLRGAGHRPGLLDVAFVDTPGVLGGVGYASAAEDVLAWHGTAIPTGHQPGRQAGDVGPQPVQRAVKVHEVEPGLSTLTAVNQAPRRRRTYRPNYRKYADLVNSARVAPRHLLSTSARPCHPGDAGGKPVGRILRRFSTAAREPGRRSARRHYETLAIAMNRLGGMSNSGEGGEAEDRYFTERASKIKQVASGRFGVTPNT